MDMGKQISPVNTNDILCELQKSLINMFGMSPRTKEEMSSLEANLMGEEARKYYLAKRDNDFITKDEEVEIGKRMAA